MTKPSDSKIESLGKRISVAAQGDLRPIEVEGIGGLSEIQSSVNRLLGEFRGLVHETKVASEDIIKTSTNVASSAEQINTSAQQISTTVQQIAKGSQQQAQEIEEINRLVENLSVNTKSLSSKAARAAEFSSAVGLSSLQGSRSASEAAAKINRIIEVSEESASNIRVLADRCNQVSSVLDVIRKIAGKTNLLALNAAIEAARAGEAGKGFAVVADEVKGLAEGSAKSSEEIEVIIQRIQQDAKITASSIEAGLREINEGKAVINRALTALEEIAKKVQVVDTTVKAISGTITGQVDFVEQLGKRATDIAAFAEQNAAATEECAAASEEESAGMQEITSAIHDFSNLGEQLQSLLRRYKLQENIDDQSQAPANKASAGVAEAQ